MERVIPEEEREGKSAVRRRIGIAQAGPPFPVCNLKPDAAPTLRLCSGQDPHGQSRFLHSAGSFAQANDPAPVGMTGVGDYFGTAEKAVPFHEAQWAKAHMCARYRQTRRQTSAAGSRPFFPRNRHE